MGLTCRKNRKGIDMITVNDVITHLTASMGNIDSTVDTLKSGEGLVEVRGIATTFMPSYHVLVKAASRGLNLVIAHEALFYNHRDQIDILESDPVYLAKKRFIDETGIAVFRLHDHMHRNAPDRIVMGLINELGWAMYVDNQSMSSILPLHVSPLTIPTMRLKDVAEHIKQKLRVSFVRIVGDLSMPCSRVGILPGYCGSGSLAIPFFQHGNLDLVITGEGPEWETPEYVRDAVDQGMNKALIIVGHESSEEWGMKYLAQSMQDIYPDIPVEFIAEKHPIQFV